ncbi:hypothetical protein BCT47_01685 [Vibrio splendidus]|jgi:hypothetical protein|uniref:Uncharacterized protein n=2 Tax=Vibrio splendidus TaxID=29497 RepID=A0AB35MWE5_VIBSP|nr:MULTISPECIES: hypothetical protein [Vibrio]MBE8565615.1 hypothetical protein [Vibrio sp. OPT20]MDH5886899.1 hypothetical protein [Vibrio splendidus]MDH5904140.1 hypothetical protein [Vibrio splendidus]MDH5976321.1 hypothetical protein [Vibrio splendidus]MDH6018507.1 hypothetical protein [Vibrio splendidus]
MNIKHHLQTVGIALIISVVTFSLGALSLTQESKVPIKQIQQYEKTHHMTGKELDHAVRKLKVKRLANDYR